MSTLTLPYPPSGNRYWRHAKGRTYLSAEARAYRAAVARVAPTLPLDGPVSVTLTVYRPRKAGDLDNTFKVLLDALNGLAWHDDSQIEELHGYRHDDKDAPRVEVEVKRLSWKVPVANTARSRCAVDGCRAKRYAGMPHCRKHVGFTPPRSPPVDAPALAAETFAPPEPGSVFCTCTREQTCAACSMVTP